jgi:putative peptide maturation dehydrogenase
LHAVEAFLLVQNVESLQPGLYHYHPVEHALQPLRALDASTARAQAALFVAQQPWFVDAAVMVILVARFARNFWKYRNHAKTYRALILDAGHLSHHQYLVATELGLAAFITAAVNEGDIEDAFGLDPMQEGVIAVTGFGWRGERMEVLEFDPLKQVWPEWTPE